MPSAHTWEQKQVHTAYEYTYALRVHTRKQEQLHTVYGYTQGGEEEEVLGSASGLLEFWRKDPEI